MRHARRLLSPRKHFAAHVLHTRYSLFPYANATCDTAVVNGSPLRMQPTDTISRLAYGARKGGYCHRRKHFAAHVLHTGHSTFPYANAHMRHRCNERFAPAYAAHRYDFTTFLRGTRGRLLSPPKHFAANVPLPDIVPFIREC